MLSSCENFLVSFAPPEYGGISLKKRELYFDTTNIIRKFVLEKKHFNEYILKIYIPISGNTNNSINTSTQLVMLIDRYNAFALYPQFMPRLVECYVDSYAKISAFEVQYELTNESISALSNARYLELQINQNQFLYGKVNNLTSLRNFFW